MMGIRYKVFGFGRLGGAVFIYQKKKKKASCIVLTKSVELIQCYKYETYSVEQLSMQRSAPYPEDNKSLYQFTSANLQTI